MSQRATTPRVVMLSSAFLVGLNVAFLGFFFVAISSAAIASALSVEFSDLAGYLMLGVAGAVGVALGALTGRWVAPWFGRRGRTTGFVLLALLLLFTVLFFPGPFSYTSLN